MNQREEQEQIAIMHWARLQEQAHPELRMLHHIPNGGQRSKATAGRLKAAGVKSGVPDLCLPVPRGGYHGLYIELKVGKNKPTQNQREWLEALKGYGFYTAVCYGFSEAVATLEKYIKQEASYEYQRFYHE